MTKEYGTQQSRCLHCESLITTEKGCKCGKWSPSRLSRLAAWQVGPVETESIGSVASKPRAARLGTRLEQREQYISELRAEKAELAADNERLRKANDEQAAPTPGVAGVQGEYDALTAARRIAVNVAAERDQLAAEVERLRGLLAQMTDIIDHLLSQNTDNLMRAGIEQSETLTPANLAAIEAAKEASNAD